MHLKTKNSIKIPKLYSLRIFRKKISGLITLREIACGFYNNITQMLTLILASLHAKKKIKGNETIRVKLAGDGVNIGIRKMLNFTLSIINDEENCKSAKGHFSLGMFEIQNEDYDQIIECLRGLIADTKVIKKIVIPDSTSFDVQFYLGGDLKFLAIVCGINSANANHPCIWCQTNKNDFRSKMGSCSILDVGNGARNLRSEMDIHGE